MARTKQFDEAEILEKAMELFWKKGFHATSIQDLVAHLGINRASMYSTFGSKEALFKEALKLYASQGSANPDALDAALTNTTARAFLEHFILDRVQFTMQDCDRKGCFIVNTTTEMANLRQDVNQEVCHNMTRAIATFSYVIEVGRTRGEVNNDAPTEVLARHLYVFFSGLQVTAMLEQQYQNLYATVQQELNWIFGGLGENKKAD